MQLELPIYSDKVTVLNPDGHVGILTLWSKVDTVLKKIGEMPKCVAAISNFYGDGISQLLVNLLYNPQIRSLFIVGNNRTGSLQELVAFFNDGLEKVKINGSEQFRIIGTTRLVNSALGTTKGETVTGGECDLFLARRPTISSFVDGTLDEQVEKLRESLKYQAHTELFPPNRVLVKLAEPKISVLPSVRAGHQIISDNALDAWSELLFAIQRFGLPVMLAKGERKELANLKVVITNPGWQSEDAYKAYNLDKSKLEDYCRSMLAPDLDADTTYTYGHRLFKYFQYDMVTKTIERLRNDPEDRKCYYSLWDPVLDMNDCNADGSKRGHPCWVGAFWRIMDGQLLLSATFRTHRAYTAWIENVHGLINLQTQVAAAIGVPVGPLTIISHSISIDPGQLPLVESVIQVRKWKLRDDARGEVMFSINDGKAVVEHKMSGILLKRYETANVEALGHQLAQDMVVSDLNHALYVGKQLGKIQMCLKNNLPYEEA